MSERDKLWRMKQERKHRKKKEKNKRFKKVSYKKDHEWVEEIDEQGKLS